MRTQRPIPRTIPLPAILVGAHLQRGSVVFRIEHDPIVRSTQIFACDIASKQWFQTGHAPWPVQRRLLASFGVAENALATTEQALAGGTLDAQFAAVSTSIHNLQQAGFLPIAW